MGHRVKKQAKDGTGDLIIFFSHIQELYTYNVRAGDSFVLDEKVRLRQLNKASRGSSSATSCGSSTSSGSNSCNSSSGSFSPTHAKGYTSLQARTGQSSSSFGGHSPRTSTAGAESSPPRRDRRSSGGEGTAAVAGSSGAHPAARNLFSSSRSKRFGEFHHSKVFHDHNKPGNWETANCDHEPREPGSGKVLFNVWFGLDNSQYLAVIYKRRHVRNS